MVGDDDEVAAEFLSGFADSLRGLKEEFRTAAADDDTARVAALAHRLQSSSRSMGALALGDLCAELGQAVADGQAIESRVTDLGVAMDRTRCVVDQHLEMLTAAAREAA